MSIFGDRYLENLYSYEGAGTLVRGTTNPSAKFNTGATAINLTDVGLVVGDTISASADIMNEVGGEQVRLEIEFRTGTNGGGSAISTVNTVYANLVNLTRVVLENITIPATTQSFWMYLRRNTGSGNITGHKGMINRGPIAMPYARPWRNAAYSPLPLWVEGYSRARFQPVGFVSLFEPFGQRPITQKLNGGQSDYWEANLTTLVETAEDMRRFAAWAMGVGLYGKVALRDPLQQDPGEDDRPLTWNGLVNGTLQSGNNSLVSDTWQANKLIMHAGTQFEVSGRYYLSRGDVTTDGSGNATIPLWPTLTNVADNAIIHIVRPHLQCLLLNLPELDYFAADLAQAQAMGFREDK